MKNSPSINLTNSLPSGIAPSVFRRKTKGSSQVSILVLIASALLFLAGLVFFMKSRSQQGAETASSAPPVSKPFPPRKELDSKLVFMGKTFTPFPPHDWAFEGISPPVTIQEDRPFPVINSVWGKTDVFAIHPLSQSEPGTVDFSAVTQNAQGTLEINIRDHPKGDCRIEVLKSGTILHSMVLDQDEWQALNVPFANETVTLNIHATGWACEHAFLTYEFKNQ